MRVSVTDDCVACEQCVDICPEVFEMGDDIAEVLAEEVPEDLEDAAQEAAETCPSDAIVVED